MRSTNALLPLFGLPEAGLLLVMASDQFLEMNRTAINVLGNSIAAARVELQESVTARATQ